jgi:osmotically-inducible protein OsmY
MLTRISIVILLFIFLQGCVAVVAGTAATSVMVAQDRRTAGTIVEDKSIQLKAMKIIERIAYRNSQVHVSAISYNNCVLLVGQVPTQQMRIHIEQSVRKIKKIKALHNEISVKIPTPLAVRSSDSWITTRIKAEMAIEKDFNPTRVKVITENGIVYLLGIVKASEEPIAVDIARHTKGVRKVVKIFEYER